MISEVEVHGIVQEVAKRLGVPAPRLSFVPRKISFMPVMVSKGELTVTPAARAALSKAAIEFAVLKGLVESTVGDRFLVVRQISIIAGGLIAGRLAAHYVIGPTQGLVALAVSLAVMVLGLVLTVSIRAKWPTTKIDRTILRHIPNLEGAREYARVTDRQNLNGMEPEPWTGAHGALVDLQRLERISRQSGHRYV